MNSTKKTNIALLAGILFFICSNLAESQNIISGRINTEGKFSFQYGTIEARIKLPKTANGLWPAFWLLGDDFSTAGWPECGEIDIMEMGNKTGIDNGTQEYFLTQAAHWGKMINGGHPNYAKSGEYVYNLQDDFHVFTMTWDENNIRMYIDDNPNATYDILINSREGDYPVIDYFHKPYFILFNLAVGGSFSQIYAGSRITALNSSNNYEANMYVDYVRVYDTQKNLLWEDTFDGPVLDETKWNIEENSTGGGNHELQLYTRENVSIGIEPQSGKSCLVLSAKVK